MLASLLCGEPTAFIPVLPSFLCGNFYYTSRAVLIFSYTSRKSFSNTSRAGFVFLSGDFLLTHPVLAPFLSGEFLLHIPCWLYSFLGSFFHTCHAGSKKFFPLIWGVSLTHTLLFFFIWAVSLTQPVLASFLSGEFLLHIPC